MDIKKTRPNRYWPLSYWEISFCLFSSYFNFVWPFFSWFHFFRLFFFLEILGRDFFAFTYSFMHIGSNILSYFFLLYLIHHSDNLFFINQWGLDLYCYWKEIKVLLPWHLLFLFDFLQESSLAMPLQRRVNQKKNHYWLLHFTCRRLNTELVCITSYSYISDSQLRNPGKTKNFPNYCKSARY